MFNGKVLPEFPDWLPEDHAGLSRWLNEITNRAAPVTQAIYTEMRERHTALYGKPLWEFNQRSGARA